MFLLLITGLYLIDALSAASCDKTLFASSGTITSPNYYGSSLYSSNLNCQYDIYVSSGGTNVVKLTWESFDVNGDMPNCYEDNVEIYIGCDRQSIGKYCSKNSYKPFTVYSPDRCLRLVFRTDSSGGGTGFKATFRGISKSAASLGLSGSCYGTDTLYNDVGVISSVGWPNSDRNARDCYWKIWVGSGNGVKIAFMDVNLDDDPGCDRDKIKVKGGYDSQSYDSASTIQYSMCGTKKAFSLTSSKERVWIRFKSNGYFNRRGFVAGYVTYSTSGSRDVSSKGLSSSGVTGIVVTLIIVAVFGSCIYYIFVYRRRVLRRQQGAQHQVLSVPPNTTTVQTVTHHAPKPPQPGHEIPGAGYPPPPPSGYAPPPGGYPPPASSAPPPYHQVAGTPYPPMVAGGAPPYPPGQPGAAAAPYPPGQPGTAPPYPPEHPGAGPYPPPPSGGAPYPKQ